MVSGEPALASEIEPLLKGLGFEVTILQDSNQLEALLGDHRYQLAVVNQRLPGLSWHGTMRHVRSMAPETAVMVMTRTDIENDVREALAAGSYIVLHRPLAMDDLATLISGSGDGLFIALRR
jgi:DNA-binding response OmpR family regulator